jgi:hypothetical protein
MPLPMVKEPGVPDRADMRPGMAYFAKTGPAGKTCGDCEHRGYYRDSATSRSSYWVSKCGQFKAMTGRHGADVKTDYPACKYFEAKPK